MCTFSQRADFCCRYTICIEWHVIWRRKRVYLFIPAVNLSKNYLCTTEKQQWSEKNTGKPPQNGHIKMMGKLLKTKEHGKISGKSIKAIINHRKTKENQGKTHQNNKKVTRKTWENQRKIHQNNNKLPQNQRTSTENNRNKTANTFLSTKHNCWRSVVP